MNSHEILNELLLSTKEILTQSINDKPVTFESISQTLHNLVDTLNVKLYKFPQEMSATSIYNFAEVIVNSLPNRYDEISVDEVPVPAIFQRLQNDGWAIIPPNI